MYLHHTVILASRGNNERFLCDPLFFANLFNKIERVLQLLGVRTFHDGTIRQDLLNCGLDIGNEGTKLFLIFILGICIARVGTGGVLAALLLNRTLDRLLDDSIVLYGFLLGVVEAIGPVFVTATVVTATVVTATLLVIVLIKLIVSALVLRFFIQFRIHLREI